MDGYLPRALPTRSTTLSVALHWYYELRQRLIETDLIRKYSPADMIGMLRHLRTVYVDGAWHTAELTKKEGDAIAALGVDIT